MARPPLPIGTWGTIRRETLADGSGVAVAKFRDYDGRTRKVERTGKTPAAAERNLRAALSERATPAGSALTADSRLEDLAAQWLAELDGRDLAPRSREQYRKTWKTHIADAAGGWTLRECTVARLDALVSAIGRRSVSNGRLARTVLSAMLSRAAQLGAIASNPVRDVAKVSAPKDQREEPRALTGDQARAVRAVMAGWVYAEHYYGPRRDASLLDLFDVLLGTGARTGEVLALRWADVDLERARVTITGTAIQPDNGAAYRQTFTKSAHGRRTLFVPSFAVEVLRRRSREVPRFGEALVFPSAAGTVRSPNNVRRLWRAPLEGTEWEWVTPRTLRKTVATIIDALMSTEDAADQLGHSGTRVTRAHYVQRTHQAPDVTGALEGLGPVKDQPGDSEDSGEAPG